MVVNMELGLDIHEGADIGIEVDEEFGPGMEVFVNDDLL